jgi:hypothetical protein
MKCFAVLLLSSLLPSLAQSADADANQIVQECVKQMSRSVRLRNSYTYKFLDEVKTLDRSGQVKETRLKLIEILYFGGKPYEHLLERDGKPLSPGEQKREQDKLNRAAQEAAKLTPAEREARQAKLDRERDKDNEWLQFIPKAYNFAFQPDVDLNGRSTYVLVATPKADYRGKYDNLLRNMQGKLFIDKSDYTLARTEADVLQSVSFGLFLGRLSKGTRLSFEQLRVNDEVWLPKNATAHVDARALVKAYRFDEHVVFSDYRKFQSESRIVPVSDH